MADAAPRAPTLFLSYASEDRDAARRIGAALPGYGIEVWYDESELGGGDAWDQKIRRQIRECDYFMALISAQTEARREGYFRREWRLASERTLDMADDHPFLLPVVIDETEATRARVPEKFQSVQWLKVPDGEPTAAFEAMCRRLAAGQSAPAAPRASIHPGGSSWAGPPGAASRPSEPSQPSQPSDAAAPFSAPAFPIHEPGQSVRFYVEVLGWAFRSAYQLFRRLPRWIRYGLIIWAVIAFLSRGHSSRHVEHDVSPDTQKKLDAVASQYGKNPAMNLSKLGAMVAQEFGDAADASGVSVLALPFAGAAGDDAAQRLADSAFAQTYTRISVTKHAHLVAGDSGAPGCALDALLERGRARHTQYVLCGAIDAAGPAQALSVTLAAVKGGKVLWSGQYPTAAADAAKIALDVAAQVPAANDDDD